MKACGQACTQCGACVNSCPVFQRFKAEEYSPKAKQLLMQTALRDASALDWDTMTALAGHCTSCGRCQRACAVKLSVPDRLAEVRGRHPKWQQYAWREWVRHGDKFWPPAKALAPLMPHSLLPPKLSILHSAALAMRAPEAVEPWIRLRSAPDMTAGGALPLEGKRVALFAGCTASRLRQTWIEKTTKLIHRLGGTVLEDSNFQCCGGTYEHAGLQKAHHSAIAHNVAQWEAVDRPLLVVFCASCVHSLRHYVHTPLFASSPLSSLISSWTQSIRPLSEVMDCVLFEATDKAPETLAYHSPCHWDGKDADMSFLRTVLPQMQQGAALCCGFGGVLKLLNPMLSKDLAERCWDGFADGKARVVLTGCSGCVMQLSAHAPEQASVYHWLDVVQV